MGEVTLYIYALNGNKNSEAGALKPETVSILREYSSKVFDNFLCSVSDSPFQKIFQSSFKIAGIFMFIYSALLVWKKGVDIVMKQYTPAHLPIQIYIEKKSKK